MTDPNAKHLSRMEEELVGKAVFVITAQVRQDRAGMTAAWVTRVSARPALMAVAIHRASRTGELIAEAGRFVINALRAEQEVCARRFGRGSSRRQDKFEGLDLRRSSGGCPVLVDSLGYIECSVVEVLELGDHRLFVGEIVEAERIGQGRPLFYSAALDPEIGG